MKTAPVIIVQLVHIEGPMKGEIQEFSESEVSIGRHPSCQVQFPKDLTTISRMHATIVREGNRFKLINQGANGTFVNGKRCDEVYLKDGDVLTITENGPKVSFLTEMKEGEEIPSSSVSRQPEVKMPEIPPAELPESADSAGQAETPLPPLQPEGPVPSVQRKSTAPVSRPEPRAPQVKGPAPVPPSPKEPQVSRVQRKTVSQQRPRESSPVQAQTKSPARPQRQQQNLVQEIPVRKVQVPFVIQLGPTLRSFKELPVTIGKSAQCDFVLNYPAIIDHHARIFYGEDQYWVKDLTGQQVVSINGEPVGLGVPLRPDDTLALSTSGPRFRFLGGGRLAEIEEPVREEPIQDKPAGPSHENREAFSPKDQAEKLIKGAKNVLDKFLQR